MKFSCSDIYQPVIIGPFFNWDDIPEDTLLKIVDDSSYHNHIVIRPHNSKILLALNKFSVWSSLYGATPPLFKFVIMPKDFSVTLTQE